MNISFIVMDVENVPTQKGSYNKGVVTYKNLATNKVEAKTILDFSNKEVWETLEKAQKGDTFSVDQQKNDKGFWQWVGIHRQDAAVVGQQTDAAPKPAPARSNWETPEERANRQIYIIRQSSLATAVEFLKDKGKTTTVEQVLDTAKRFEEYVVTLDDQPE